MRGNRRPGEAAGEVFQVEAMERGSRHVLLPVHQAAQGLPFPPQGLIPGRLCSRWWGQPLSGQGLLLS